MFILTAFLTGLISYYISSIFNKGVYLFLLFFSFVVLNIEGIFNMSFYMD